MRVLMYLALDSDRLTTVTEISESYGISRNHLTKIVHQLGKAHYIETVRGRSGGIRLAKPADSISVGKIIRLMESPSVLVECFPGGKQGCVISPACKLKHVLAEAEDAFYTYLDGFTLADVTTNSDPLRSLLYNRTESGAS
jgi:Rrf2 family nitric oxide-sensitive transcriptional repressor